VDFSKINPTPTRRHSDDAATCQQYNYISWTDAFCNYHRYLSEPSTVTNLAGIDLDVSTDILIHTLNIVTHVTTPAASRSHADSTKLRSPVHHHFLSQTSYANISIVIPQCSSPIIPFAVQHSREMRQGQRARQK